MQEGIACGLGHAALAGDEHALGQLGLFVFSTSPETISFPTVKTTAAGSKPSTRASIGSPKRLDDAGIQDAHDRRLAAEQRRATVERVRGTAIAALALAQNPRGLAGTRNPPDLT